MSNPLGHVVVHLHAFLSIQTHGFQMFIYSPKTQTSTLPFLAQHLLDVDTGSVSYLFLPGRLVSLSDVTGTGQLSKG